MEAEGNDNFAMDFSEITGPTQIEAGYYLVLHLLMFLVERGYNSRADSILRFKTQPVRLGKVQ